MTSKKCHKTRAQTTKTNEQSFVAQTNRITINSACTYISMCVCVYWIWLMLTWCMRCKPNCGIYITIIIINLFINICNKIGWHCRIAFSSDHRQVFIMTMVLRDRRNRGEREREGVTQAGGIDSANAKVRSEQIEVEKRNEC